MEQLRRLLLVGMAVTALLFSGCAGDGENQAAESESVPPAESEALPTEQPSAPQISFEGTDLGGNTVSDHIFSQSKLTMINVWATYCNPCLSEMPDLGELAAAYDPSEFQIIGIVSDVMEGEDQTLVEDLVNQTEADYPHLLVNESIYYTFLTSVSAMPTTFFVDQEGRALGYLEGALEKSAWEEIINGLLEDL